MKDGIKAHNYAKSQSHLLICNFRSLSKIKNIYYGHCGLFGIKILLQDTLKILKSLKHSLECSKEPY